MPLKFAIKAASFSHLVSLYFGTKMVVNVFINTRNMLCGTDLQEHMQQSGHTKRKETVLQRPFIEVCGHPMTVDSEYIQTHNTLYTLNSQILEHVTLDKL